MKEWYYQTGIVSPKLTTIYLFREEQATNLAEKLSNLEIMIEKLEKKLSTEIHDLKKSVRHESTQFLSEKEVWCSTEWLQSRIY